MDNMTLLIAGIAALAILLIAVGIAMSGGGSGINARLERYASNKPDTPPDIAIPTAMSRIARAATPAIRRVMLSTAAASPIR